MRKHLKASPEVSADCLRAQLATVLGVPFEDRFIFTPSILAGVRILAPCLGVRRLVLTTAEYYDTAHFPGLDCHLADFSDLIQAVKVTKPEMVLASVVTWKGDLLPIGEMFRSIRQSLGRECPLLVADGSHVGAAGFPRLDSLCADIVCGDGSKWLLAPSKRLNVGFLWSQSVQVFSRLRPVFAPFFLAVKGASSEPSSRWIPPDHIVALQRFLSRKRLSRTKLNLLHQRNMELANDLASRSDLCVAPKTSILWFPKGTISRLPRELADQGLVWEFSDGTRVMCRADLLNSTSQRTGSAAAKALRSSSPAMRQARTKETHEEKRNLVCAPRLARFADQVFRMHSGRLNCA